ncbi:hypothetical protein BC829DRAFT_408720 [Chytridium lagenaria]|nr:hypothetical protein BC829DRAFT_408720 [Chytridium lagenaria]
MVAERPLNAPTLSRSLVPPEKRTLVPFMDKLAARNLLDLIQVQFYNNDGYGCNINNVETNVPYYKAGFNFKEWIGILGNPTAGGSGFMENVEDVAGVIRKIGTADYKSFAGIFIWDASAAEVTLSKPGTVETYASGIRRILDALP